MLCARCWRDPSTDDAVVAASALGEVANTCGSVAVGPIFFESGSHDPHKLKLVNAQGDGDDAHQKWSKE